MKKLISLILILLLMTSCVVMVACDGDDDDGATAEATSAETSEATAEPTEEPTAAETEEATADGTEKPTSAPTADWTAGELPDPGEIDPVDFKEMMAYIPDAPSGWEADDIDGMSMTMFEYPFTQAWGDYTSADESASVAIFDSAFYYGFGWFGLWETAFEIETSDMYMKKVTVGGYPTWEIWDESDGYINMVFVDERFMVMIEANTEESLELFIDQVDFDGIASLG